MSDTIKVRLLQDCEHGEKGKVLDVPKMQEQMWLDEGKVEILPDEPPLPGPVEEPEPEPLIAVAPVRKPVPPKPVPARKLVPKPVPKVKPRPAPKPTKPPKRKGKR